MARHGQPTSRLTSTSTSRNLRCAAEPENISILTGSLGQVFVDNGIDVHIGNAVAAAIGFDPGFSGQVAAESLPASLTNPPISAIPPFPTLGGIGFTIDLDSDDDGLLDGEELAMGLDPDNPDTNDDGLNDGDEVYIRGADPLDPDTNMPGAANGIKTPSHLLMMHLERATRTKGRFLCLSRIFRTHQSRIPRTR